MARWKLTYPIVVASLWNGGLIQSIDENDDIQYVPYHKSHREDFWSHINPSRMSVPRYQNVFRIVVWFIFLGVYSLAVREPIERLNPVHASLDPWEYALYIMALAFCLEDLHRGYKLIQYATRRSYGFWSAIALITNTLLLLAFIFRVAGFKAADSHAGDLRLKSFQILSFVAPFIWYIGTMQICVSRMLQESGIFFSLLCLLGAGFLQAMYALDVADGQVEDVSSVINVLLQGLLQSPDYARFASSPVGLTLYYLWNLSTAVILLNILISLFASAYSEVIGDAEAEYMAFFAWKTVAMIRAPDSYAYPAPFNLVEIVFIAPLEFFGLTRKNYAKLNRIVMTVIFFIPLSVIAFFEASSIQRSWVMHWLDGEDEIDFDNPATIDPIVEGPEAEHGLQISKVPFNELARKLPHTEQSTEATILKELSDIQQSLHVLSEQIHQLRT
ncbi:calcium activated cation channel [Boletus reticuloceps]|uniref:Calcium activated cation channel n=1 Tax=Boletus reticuloceps TaxID=495285 RepID=A0A8I3AAY6_9AGAM|nr:calcium activated cation channel [Boletus reticuloceps]